jgi:short subunit dehydrogenase-like uncharacterized protein
MSWLLYGATGYTGQLLAEEAVRRGHRPVLGGRSAQKLAPLADKLGLQWVKADLEDPAALGKAVRQASLVLHAAGPFRFTARPMIAACLEAGAHYLDITGEIPVFQHTFAQDAAARRNGLALISGAGFDVIPTDCLAAATAARLPGADRLGLAIAGQSRVSAGTLKSSLESLPEGGQVRRDGALLSYPFGAGAHQVRFLDRERTVLPIPWGDLETAYRSTGIPNITTCMAFPKRTVRLLRLVSPLAQNLLKLSALRRLASALAGKIARGPDQKLRLSGRSQVWACVSKGEAEQVQAWLETIEPYAFTAIAGIRCVEKLIDRPPAAAPHLIGAPHLSGALTPAQAFGAGFVLEIEGTRMVE